MTAITIVERWSRKGGRRKIGTGPWNPIDVSMYPEGKPPILLLEHGDCPSRCPKCGAGCLLINPHSRHVCPLCITSWIEQRTTTNVLRK